MFKKRIRFSIVARDGASIEEVFAMIEKIKKVHPNAKIDIRVEV